jgi:hypothetical protein
MVLRLISLTPLGITADSLLSISYVPKSVLRSDTGTSVQFNDIYPGQTFHLIAYGIVLYLNPTIFYFHV